MTAGVGRLTGIRSSWRVSWMHVTVFLVGLAAFALNLSLLNAKEATQPVAVAAIDLPAGTHIAAGDLQYTSIQAPDSLVASLVGREEAAGIEGFVLGKAIGAGDLITRSDLRPPGAPSELRAFSIALPPERAVAGALLAGDRVDVVAADDGTAVYLAGGLEVLEVTGGEGGIGLSSFSVTVAADSETILHLAAALDSSTVSLVRSTGAAPPTIWELPIAEEEAPDG